MIKTILFDIDNTLLDFDAYCVEGMKRGFELFNLPPFEDHMGEVFFKVNTKLWQEIERGEITYEELLSKRWKTVFEILGISFDGSTFENYFKGELFHSVILIDGAVELLEYLKGKYIMCVASNGAYAQQMNRLTKSGMIGYFDHVFISEKIGVPKPSALFFDYCMDEINKGRDEKITPSDVILIGDSISSDISGAVNYGIKTCLFDRHGDIDKQGFEIDYVVNNLREIKKFL